MSKYILVCKCPGMDKKAIAAYSILFPNQDIPDIVIGKNKILKLWEQTQGTNFGEYIKALSKNRDEFARYFDVDEKGDVVRSVNLLTGKDFV